MSDGEREILRPRRKSPQDKRAELSERDFQNLALDDRFLRFLFTVLSTAGMFGADFHSDSRIHAWRAGRRSLGLDLLRMAEKYLGPDALSRILEAEKKTLIGGSIDTRSIDRDTDIDGDADDGDDVDNRSAVDRPVVLQYD